jgi:hypothetical protein
MPILANRDDVEFTAFTALAAKVPTIDALEHSNHADASLNSTSDRLEFSVAVGE